MSRSSGFEHNTFHVGAMIRRLRKASGMSQTALAEKLDISYQQVQKYEKGTSELTLKRLRQVALALNVPLSVFMGDQKDATLIDEEMQVLSLYRGIADGSLRQAARTVLAAISRAARETDALDKQAAMG